MKRKIAAILVCCLAFGMTACGGAKGGNADNDSKVYAVEAGSAGEAAAKEKGFKYNSVSSQADALMEVASGTSDAAIIAILLFAKYLITILIGGHTFLLLKYSRKMRQIQKADLFRNISDAK